MAASWFLLMMMLMAMAMMAAMGSYRTSDTTCRTPKEQEV
jgi:hypothetical protein